MFAHLHDNNNYVYALMTLVSKIQGNEISLGQMKWLYERAIMSAVPDDEKFIRKSNLEKFMQK